MNRKWWKVLLPLPFIFIYCYCVSFPGGRKKDAQGAFIGSQQESQIAQEPKQPPRTTEPPPPAPPEMGSQSPPGPSEKPATPVPQNPANNTQEILSAESVSSQLTQIESPPDQSATQPSTPPPLSPAAMQALSSALDEAALPATTSTEEPARQMTQADQALLALASLSAFESENELAKESESPIPQDDKAQQVSQIDETQETQEPLLSLVDIAQKHDNGEYERSTAKVSVSKETFDTDKRRILNMISDLDTYMETGDYKGWLTCLSDESRTYWSRPQNLRKAAAKLPVSGLKLNNMEDYFNYVFVPARMGRKVEEIRYVTETQVKAVQVEDNVDMVFYHFKKVDDKWKLFLPKIKD